MKNEAEKAQCGLKFKGNNVIANDSKNFGPEKYKSSYALATCEFKSCPLSDGVAVNFTTIADESKENIAARLESMSTTPGESVNKQLGLAKLKNCIAYKTELSKLS